jgi:protein-tyrosine phosphatase
MFTLHLVCMGNLCRSPMAAAVFRARLPAERCRVVSAGLVVPSGRPIAPLTVAVLQAKGLTVPEAPPCRFDPATLADDDLVLAMQHRHVRALRALVPHARSRIQLLGRWMPQPEIDDPMGGELEDFERAFARIADCVDQWCTRDARFSTRM